MAVDKSPKGYDAKAQAPSWAYWLQASGTLSGCRMSCLAQEETFLKSTLARVWEGGSPTGEEVMRDKGAKVR